MHEFENKHKDKNVIKFNLRKISNDQLDQNLKSAVLKEREILSVILEHIVEVDRRKLFLTLAYPSLFDYLTKHIGYSAGSAHRRIDAARLSKEVPEVISKLEQGSLNLAQVGLLQKSVRQCLTENKQKVSLQTKKQLIDDLIGKSFNESQILVSRTLDIQIKELPKVTHQQNESVRLEISLTKQQWQKLNQMRELLSSSLPNGSESWDQVLEYVSDKVIAQKSPKVKKTAENFDHSFSKSTHNADPSKKTRTLNQDTRTSLPKKLRDQVLDRDKCCQFKNAQSNKICGSKWRLHVDHIKPVWAGGKNDIQNLRILCASHNLEIYRSQSATIFS